jgi:hypothetical protein
VSSPGSGGRECRIWRKKEIDLPSQFGFRSPCRLKSVADSIHVSVGRRRTSSPGNGGREYRIWKKKGNRLTQSIWVQIALPVEKCGRQRPRGGRIADRRVAAAGRAGDGGEGKSTYLVD